MLYEMPQSPDNEEPRERIIKLTDVDDGIACYSFSIQQIITQADGSTKEFVQTIELDESNFALLETIADFLELEGIEDLYLLMFQFAAESTEEDVALFRDADLNDKIDMLKVFLNIRNDNDPSEFTIEDWTPERDFDEDF